MQKKRKEVRQLQPEKRSFKKLNLIIIGILIIILAISIYLYIPKNCKNNANCFIKKAQTCSKANVLTYKEDNLYSYEIKGSLKDSCLVNIKLVRMKPNTDVDLVELMEGKGMLCKIPKDKFKQSPLSDIKDINDYCSGPLKEAYLQLTIERLYSLVISNIGGITRELQDLINRTA